MLFSLTLSPTPGSSDPILSRTQVIRGMMLSSALLLLIAVACLQISSLTWRDLPFQVSVPAVGAGSLLGVVIWGISRGLYQVWIPYQRASGDYMALVLQPLKPLDLIWLGLLPGISEEILFRGILLGIWGTGWEAVTLSSTLFGAAHLLSPKMWPYGVWAGVVGLVMAVSFVLSGNLLVPICAHVVTNILSGSFWQRQYHQQRE